MLKIYGHYVSQPTRALLWLCTIKKLPFDFVKIDPAAGQHRSPEFKSKFPGDDTTNVTLYNLENLVL